MSGLLGRLSKGAEKSDSGDWIITFADLMTLLFCFFVLLTTLSTAPKNCAGLVDYFEQNRAFFKNFELRNSKLECVITLPSDFLFRSGEDRLQPAALRRLGPLFRTIDQLNDVALGIVRPAARVALGVGALRPPVACVEHAVLAHAVRVPQ